MKKYLILGTLFLLFGCSSNKQDSVSAEQLKKLKPVLLLAFRLELDEHGTSSLSQKSLPDRALSHCQSAIPKFDQLQPICGSDALSSSFNGTLLLSPQLKRRG